MTKTCYIIAGPNGAGKTTFAMDMLPSEVACQNYINADLIAAGLSPFKPELAAIEAGKLMLNKIDECVKNKQSFALETTLSGRSYLNKIKQWQKADYEVILFYFSLPSVKMALERVKYRVTLGGHNIPKATIIRRYSRSIKNLKEFQATVDGWALFDSSGWQPKLLEAFNYEI